MPVEFPRSACRGVPRLRAEHSRVKRQRAGNALMDIGYRRQSTPPCFYSTSAARKSQSGSWPASSSAVRYGLPSVHSHTSVASS